MRELALHILDLVQNSIEAGAKRVLLEIVEDMSTDTLLIRVSDNGKGMDAETKKKVVDPFVTSRTTRRVGLGLPLIDMSTKQCDGYLKIESELGKGTVIEAAYRHSHLDRPPLGNMLETLKTLIIANPELDFNYRHMVNGEVFILSTCELSDILAGVPFSHPDVIVWLQAFLSESLNNLYGGAKDENH
ncbi:MAG: putative system histidine kinase [Firmicutes bacterium]|nr:putative system histidine kinase [Bacillota bacterium]